MQPKGGQGGKHEAASHSPQKTAAGEWNESSGRLPGRVLHFNPSLFKWDAGALRRRLIRTWLRLRRHFARGTLLGQLPLNRELAIAVFLAPGPQAADSQARNVRPDCPRVLI